MPAIKITLEIGHEASIRERRSPHDLFTHDWEVFVRGTDGCDIKHYVDKVVFNLHETFKKSRRVYKEPPYAVRESGYAGFVFPIDVYFKNNGEPKKITVMYDLTLQPAGPPILKVQKERHVFPNASDEFRDRLLKGGGVIVKDRDNSPPTSTTVRALDKDKYMDVYRKEKVKMSEPKMPTNSFHDLFGPPITKTSVPLKPDVKPKDSKLEKIDKKPVAPEKDTKSSSKSKHSSKEVKKEEKKDREKSHKSDKEKKEKEKIKEKKRERSPKKKEPTPPIRPVSPLSPEHKDEPPKEPSPRLEHKESTKKSKKDKRDKERSKDKEKKSHKHTADEMPVKIDEKKEKRDEEKVDKTEKIDKNDARKREKDVKVRDKEKKTVDMKEMKGEKVDEVIEKHHHKHKKRDKEKKREEKERKAEKKSKEAAKDERRSPIVEKYPTTSPEVSNDAPVVSQPEPKPHKRPADSSDDNSSDVEMDVSPAKRSKPSTKKLETKLVKSPKSPPSPSPYGAGLVPPQIVIEPPPPVTPTALLPPPSLPLKDSLNAPGAKAGDKDKKKSKKRHKHSKDKEGDEGGSGGGGEKKSEKTRKRKSSSSSATTIKEADSTVEDDSSHADTSHKKHFKEDSPSTSLSRADVTAITDVPDKSVTTKTDVVLDEVDDEKVDDLPAAIVTSSNVITPDYMMVLKDLQNKIMTLQDNSELQRVVQLIAETGQYELTRQTFDFDLCALDRSTVKRLQEFFAAT